jgi:hypothetical protein
LVVVGETEALAAELAAGLAAAPVPAPVPPVEQAAQSRTVAAASDVTIPIRRFMVVPRFEMSGIVLPLSVKRLLLYIYLR